MTNLTITSDPDTNGNHRLQCPQCLVSFFAPITKDDKTGELQNIICENCHHSDKPLMFVYTATKEQTDAAVMGYAKREMRSMLKKSLRGSRNIKFR